MLLYQKTKKMNHVMSQVDHAKHLVLAARLLVKHVLEHTTSHLDGTAQQEVCTLGSFVAVNWTDLLALYKSCYAYIVS